MEFTLLYALVAFAGGAMGAIFGCLLAFIFVAVVIAAGLGMGGSLETLGVLGFGGWGFYAPQISFAGGAFASAYAGWRGYQKSGQDITTALVSLKKPDVLLMGGVGGLLGYLCMFIHAMTPLKTWMDSVPFAVVVPALIAKIVFDGSVFGPTSPEAKAAGGRFNVNSPVVWLPYNCTGLEKLLTAAIMGVGGAYATYILAQNPNTAAWAAFLPFCISVFSLIGFYFGMAIVPNHHMVYCASFGVLMSMSNGVGVAMLWGVSMAVMAHFWADFSARACHLYSKKAGNHFDPPTAGIWLATIFIVGIFPRIGAYANPGLAVAVPVVVLAVACILAIVDQVQLKKKA
ncbi:MAG: hypothetical protein LBG84_06535 [Treponema sp.]|jgi:hypothetical protein|nr:hypothetical protein [Treponema sp.]